MVSTPFQKEFRLRPGWFLVIVAGLLFFWLNSGTPSERHEKLWQMRVWSYPQRYCDLSAVLSWMELDHQGIDTRFACPTCPCAPSPMNYGAGILWLGRAGLYRITAEGIWWLGPLLISVFLLSLGGILTRAGVWQTLFCALLLFSPPVFLGLERANLDLAIFSLIVLGVVLDRRWGNSWGFSAVLVAGALKYYPFAAAAAFLRSTRRSWAYLGVFAGASLLFLFTTRSYIATAHAADVGRFGWGAPALFKILPEILTARNIAWSELTPKAMFMPVLICAALAGIAGWKWRVPLNASLQIDPSARLLFLSGALLYTSCFAISSNFEYRSIFLFLLLPQLFLMSNRRGNPRLLAWCGLLPMGPAFLLSWYKSNDWSAIGYQLSYWALFLYGGVMLAASLFSTVAESAVLLRRRVVFVRRRGRLWNPYWQRVLVGCLLAAAVLFVYWRIARAGRNLVANPEFSQGSGFAATSWTLGTGVPAPGSCSAAIWNDTAGHPGGAILLNSCGERTANPFAAQTIHNLVAGRSYDLTFDWAVYSATVVAGAGTGRSFGVFLDFSGTPPSASQDLASRNPLFVGEYLNPFFQASPPITFVASGSTATIYFEAELDERTPGGPPTATDVAYVLDNVQVRLKP